MEEEMEVTMKEVEEAEEEDKVEGKKVEFGAMIVEILGTLAMNVQSGKTKTMKQIWSKRKTKLCYNGSRSSRLRGECWMILMGIG